MGKRIEPTDAMVRDVECWRSFTGTADRTPLRPILRAALNHYDAPGLFADEDALRAALTAALPHLTADNLRDTPGGRALMAEGWDQGWRDRKQYDQDIDWRTIPVTDTNPYRKGDA